MHDPGHIRVDAPSVHPADAVKLMVHHLQLAAMYFEATPEELAPSLAEMVRQLDAKITLPAAREWFAAMTKAYDEIDGDA